MHLFGHFKHAIFVFANDTPGRLSERQSGACDNQARSIKLCQSVKPPPTYILYLSLINRVEETIETGRMKLY